MAKEINLKEIFTVLKKRLWVIAAATIIAALAGYFYSMFYQQAPLYQSDTRVIIGADANNMSTLMVMIKDPTVLEKVSQKLNFERSPNALANEITATNIDSSQVVSISVLDSDPRLAANIANITASIFKSEASNILNFNKVQLLSEAKAIPIPINPSNHHKLYYGFIIGLIGGIGLVFLLNSMDNTIQSEQELEKILDAPALGSISKMTKKNIYRHRKGLEVRNDLTELSSKWQMGTIKKGKMAYKKSNLVHKNLDSSYKSPEPVQRANH